MTTFSTETRSIAYSNPNTNCTDAPFVSVESYAIATPRVSASDRSVRSESKRTWNNQEMLGDLSITSTLSSALLYTVIKTRKMIIIKDVKKRNKKNKKRQCIIIVSYRRQGNLQPVETFEEK